MTSRLLYCRQGGYLVDNRFSVPTDQTDACTDRMPSAIGCNRIECRDCRALVRSRLGIDYAPGAHGHFTEIYATDDWATLPFMSTRDEVGATRFYACRCGTWQANSPRALENEMVDPMSVGPPWRCAGHPQPVWPFSVDGVTVADEQEVRALVSRVIEQRWLPPDASPDFEGLWLLRWYARLCDGAGCERWRDATSVAIAELLSSRRSPRARHDALTFFQVNPKAAGADTLITRVEADPMALDDPPDPSLDPRLVGMKEDLFDRFVGVALNRIEEDEARRWVVTHVEKIAMHSRRAVSYLMAISSRVDDATRAKLEAPLRRGREKWPRATEWGG